METKKKITFIGAMLMGIGCIVGSGIFGTLPTVAAEIGPGVIYALAGAAVVVVLRGISRMYTCAALPSSASSFVHASKLIHPLLGSALCFNAFLQPTMVSLFGVLFASYFKALFPGLPLSDTVVSVGLLLAFACVAWFGNRTSATVGNVMVVLLLAAMVLYIILGLPRLDPNNVSFMQVVRPGIALSGVAASIGVLTSSLSGASSVAEIADDVENPGRTVPLALVLCPVIVAVLYILMAVVTIGVVPYAEVESLSQVAERFMSPALLTFFIVGGPICGVVTSLIPVALACVATMSFGGKLEVFPKVFCQENRHGVPVLSLLLVTAISVGICATGATFGVVMTIFSFTNTLAELPNTLLPIFAYKKYPKTCDNSSVHMNHRLAAALAIVTCCICAYLCVEMALTLTPGTVAGILAVYGVGLVYLFFRIRYLKAQGKDLFADMRIPLPAWEEKEASYK